MDFNINEIEKIVSYKTWNAKKKTDRLLEIDCSMYCNVGSDSTKSEKEEVRRNSRKIYNAIKKIDPTMGNLFLQAMDKDPTKKT
jgi:hypothetical protein